jgi:beta-lactamase superfamily II metal-dependent hydrolase
MSWHSESRPWATPTGSSSVLSVEMLPAQRGDALWITYGEPPELRHVLVDAGPRETIPTLVPELERRLQALPGGANRVELLVMTHVDADHIQGVVSLLSVPDRIRLFRDVWFNGFKHLPAPPTLGAPDGEQLTCLLEKHPKRWNKAFEGGPVVVPADGPPPTVKLAGGLELTLLSPTPTGLAKLAPRWERECRKAGLLPGHGAEVPRSARREGLLGFNVGVFARRPYRRDRAEPNGSSIAFVARYGTASVLCGADAHSEVLEAGLDRLGAGPHKLTAVKVSHHGSRGNISPAFLERVRARHWLISTNGAKFKHPHAEALARIVVTQERPTFHLNYVTPYVEDLIGSAGDDYSVKLPRKRRDGSYAVGRVVPLG